MIRFLPATEEQRCKAEWELWRDMPEDRGKRVCAGRWQLWWWGRWRDVLRLSWVAGP